MMRDGRSFCIVAIVVLSSQIAYPATRAFADGAGSDAGPITIVVSPGGFPSVEIAGHSEAKIAWRAGASRDAAACTESLAALELRHWLAACLGTADSTLALSGAATLPAGGRVFLLTSDARDPRLAGLDDGDAPPLPAGDGQGFRIYTVATRGRIVHVVQGAGPVGTLYGAYALLERLGVRFYGLGDAGASLPARPFALPDTLRRSESPGFITRGFWAWEPRGDRDFFLWMARNRLNYWTAAEKNTPFLHQLGIRLTQGGHIIQKTFLDPGGEYPYRHAGFASARTAADPYPVSADFRSDQNYDGRLSYFEAHPEWYGLVNGQRSDLIRAESGNNFCTSNADAVHELTRNLIETLAHGAWSDADILVFWMLDDGHWCECDRCRALGTPTDRLLLLLGQVQQRLRAARTDGTLGRPVLLNSLASLETLAPPTRPAPKELAAPDFALTWFPIYRCYAHALADTDCAEINQLMLHDFDGWAEAPDRQYHGAIAIGEYYNVSSLYSLPVVYAKILGADLPWYWRHGARHFNYMHVMTRGWGPWTVNHALLARLLWNPNANSGAIQREYFGLYYPASHVTTRRAYEALEIATANFKLMKHRVRYRDINFSIARQLRSSRSPFVLDHLHYKSFHPPKNDAPDMTDMLTAMALARTELNRSLASVPSGVERARLAEDDRLLRYAEATLAFFDHLFRLQVFDLRHQPEAALREWRQLEAEARRLKGMVDVVRVSSRDANAANAFEATEVVDVYQTFAKKYGAGGGK